MKRYLYPILLLLIVSLAPASVQAGENSVLPVQRYHEILRIPNGTADDESGFFAPPAHSGGQEVRGIIAYRVRNNRFYLLDNENIRILIADATGIQRVLPLPDNARYTDLEFSTRDTIFVLAQDHLIEIDMDGKLLQTASVPATDSRGFLPSTDGWLYIENQGSRVPVWNGSVVEKQVEPHWTKLNGQTGAVVLQTEPAKEIPFTFDFAAGALDVLTMDAQGMLLLKTESSPYTSLFMGETHLVQVGPDGTEQGYLRIPSERREVLIQHPVQTGNGKLYLLLQDARATTLYGCALGEEKESFLQERIERRLNIEKVQQALTDIQRNKIGFLFNWN